MNFNNIHDLRKMKKVITIERECVTRASNNQCNRDCGRCDLILPSADIIDAYNIILEKLIQ